jgi:hypothetical protein
MRKSSLSLAALALVLAGSLATVAQAANLERDHREQRSDTYAGQNAPAQAQAENNQAKTDHG